MSKNTLIIGASINRDRYSYRVIKKLIQKNHQVFAIGKKKGNISDVIIHPTLNFFDDIHTVSLYISSKNQKKYYDYVFKINPKRVIFNPGTENFDFANFLSDNSIKWENSCTLVLLSTNQY